MVRITRTYPISLHYAMLSSYIFSDLRFIVSWSTATLAFYIFSPSLTSSWNELPHNEIAAEISKELVYEFPFMFSSS